MSWHISASWMFWDPFLTISTWWSHATRLWEPPPSNMIIFFSNTQVEFFKQIRDFMGFHSNHQRSSKHFSSTFQQDLSSRGSKPHGCSCSKCGGGISIGGCRSRCAGCNAMPQSCHNARVSRKYGSSIISPCETPKHMIHMHIFDTNILFQKGIWWWTADPWSNSNGGLHSHPGLFVQLVHGPLWVQKDPWILAEHAAGGQCWGQTYRFVQQIWRFYTALWCLVCFLGS